MELRSIAFELGLERLQTETTFVKDEALKVHCQQFNEDLEEERFFRQVRPAYVTEMEHSVATIQRGSLPSGSELFRQAMLDYGKVFREQLAEKDKPCDEAAEESDVVESQMKDKVPTLKNTAKRPSQRKSSLVYPPRGQPVLRRLYSVQLDRSTVQAQSFGGRKR